MKKSVLIFGVILLTLALIGCTTIEVNKTIATTEKPADAVATEASTQASNTAAKTKSETEGFMKGFKAKEIKIKDVAGTEFVLSEHLGKVVVLNFWATWCPPCDQEIPYFNAAYLELDPNEAIIIGIDLIENDSLEDVKAKIVEHNIQYPIYLDKGNIAANDYRVRSIPTTVIVKPNGVIYEVYVGALSKESLLTFIEEAKQ
jgi:thiol-disulfide isomerase/thioredoxin